jgi:hypothetical protein
MWRTAKPGRWSPSPSSNRGGRMTKDVASQAYSISSASRNGGRIQGSRVWGVREAGAQRSSITTARKPVSFWLERNEMKRRAPGLDVCSGRVCSRYCANHRQMVGES